MSAPLPPPDDGLDLSKFRPNVGIVLFNQQSQVFLGRRAGQAGPLNWQFPQGGVDPGEPLEVAARRELEEETGVRSVTLLGRTQDWVPYHFPPELRSSKVARGFLGQKQIWFAFRFLGDDSEIDLNRHKEVEFDAWRWASLEDALVSVATFKREAYGTVISAFKIYETVSPG